MGRYVVLCWPEGGDADDHVERGADSGLSDVYLVDFESEYLRIKSYLPTYVCPCIISKRVIVHTSMPFVSPVAHDPIALPDGLHIFPSAAYPVSRTAVLYPGVSFATAACFPYGWPKRLPESTPGRPTTPLGSQIGPQQCLVLLEKNPPRPGLDRHVQFQVPAPRSTHIFDRSKKYDLNFRDDVILVASRNRRR